MDKHTQYIGVGVALLGLIIIFGSSMFFASSQVNNNLDFSTGDTTNDSGTLTNFLSQNGNEVLVSSKYIDGTYMYAGITALPTPCHDVESEVSIAKSFPEQVTINLVTQAPPADQMCAEVITPHFFSATFTVDEKATVKIMKDGKPVSVTYIEDPSQTN
jgi:hypothetical protein